MKRLGVYFVLFVGTLFLLPYTPLRAESSAYIGFMSDPIWYVPDAFSEGDTVQIHTFVFNGRQETFKGVLEFYDDQVLLGKKDISLPGGSGKEMSLLWLARAGDHKIYAKIASPKIILASGKEQAIVLENSATVADNRSVSKKALSSATETVADGMYGSVLSQIDIAGQFLKEHTPEAIQKPVTAAVDVSEGVRSSVSEASLAGKQSAEAEIKKIEEVQTLAGSDKVSTDKRQIDTEVKKPTVSKGKTSSLAVKKPFEYARLYFWSLVHFIASHAIVFYGLVFVIVLYIIRAFVNRRK